MRILHVLGSLNRGGAETWLVQVLRHIDRSKYQFDFLVHTEEPGVFDDEVRALGARVIPCLSPSNPVRYARNFRRILREYGPYDCVHSHVHHFSGYVLALAKAAGVPSRVAHSHCDTRVTDRQRGPVRRLYRAAMTRLLSTASTAGMGVSDKAARSLFGEDWQEDERWAVTHIGIDLEPFTRAVDRSSVRRELQIPDGAVVIGHVGRFFPQKNHVFLLEVANLVCKKDPRSLFILLGDGPLRPEMEEKAQRLGIRDRVRFLGVRGDVPRVMKGAMDLFFLPSLFEGFPVVLMEAQAAGLHSVIADNISSEIDVFPNAITRLSLLRAAEVWADAIVLVTKKPSASVDLRAMRNLGIGAATQRLCEVYVGK